MILKKNYLGKKTAPRQMHIISEATAPFGFVEAYRSLRTNLSFVSINNRYKKIIITSAIPEEGKSTVIINLAVSLAQEGKKVIVVDCDLRKPILHKYLKISNHSQGLSSILSGQPITEGLITTFKDLKISVLCAGAIPPNPSEMLGSGRMAKLIQALEAEYDYILFDTPPVSIVTDAAVLSRYADGVLLVVRQKHASIDTIKLAIKNLQAVNSNIIGTVLNNFDTKKIGKESGYYYAYDYEYSNK